MRVLKLAYILPRMNEAHWSALQYVERFGLEPAVDATRDLLEWGLVTRVDTVMLTTDLGDDLLEES